MLMPHLSMDAALQLSTVDGVVARGERQVPMDGWNGGSPEYIRSHRDRQTQTPMNLHKLGPVNG